ncbi:caspase, EACC1-associated type [Streptomonospora salina]|uniref:Putative RDD family membrane protein YckC n=1 Tax=Streptomonospora salina TaxID=104205 RepID=A0A841EFK6_9ACTN|nr:RDD family protein [Streptomonospora salina]MBB6000109.1 putative RDD family membrane protein YckC [Streptomonospora salina]
MSGARRALVIAQDTYADPGLTQLRSPAQDTVALAEVLGDPDVGGFDVTVVHNEPSPVVAGRVEEFFAAGRRDDALLLHFSCHGLKNVSGELFFAACDTIPRLLRSTAVSAHFVRKCMGACRARNTVLLLDCCFGGAFLEGMGLRSAGDAHVLDTFSGHEMGSGRGWAVVTASNAIEYAFEGERLTEDAPHTPSVFTSALVTGLSTGAADLDEDGRISLDELYDYLYDRVRSENPHQTPSCSVHVQGDVYLARSNRHHRALNQLPDGLHQALISPDPTTQGRGVDQLDDAMTGADISAAATAHEALLWLTRQPPGPATSQAHRVLEAATLTPTPTVLDFGRVPQGAPAPHRLLHLIGPPLARHCTARPRTPDLRVQQAPSTDGGVEVELATGRVGPIESAIILSGPTGDVHVPVTAEIVPATEADTPTVPQQAAPQPAPTAATAPSATAHWAAPVQNETTSPEPYPRMRRRVLARVIDLVIVGGAGWVLMIFAIVLGEAVGLPTRAADALINVMAALTIFGWGLLIFLYDALLLRTWGHTVGMAVVGVRVVDAADDGRPRWRQALARAAVFGLPQSVPVLGQLFVLLESLLALPDSENRPLHDIAARTLVRTSAPGVPIRR